MRECLIYDFQMTKHEAWRYWHLEWAYKDESLTICRLKIQPGATSTEYKVDFLEKKLRQTTMLVTAMISGNIK
jgi:hypothetical protein